MHCSNVDVGVRNYYFENMKITNAAGLPKPIYDLILKDEYSKQGADISVTELIDSPRVRVLRKRYAHLIETEAEDLLNAQLGKAFHKAVEEATTTGTAERRLSVKEAGWVVGGGMDHFEDGVLTDYKTCNVWKTVYAEKGCIQEFEEQLNVYAHILRKNGHEVRGLKIFALFKDWTARGFKEAARKGKLFIPGERSGYPEKSWAFFDVPLWPEEYALGYVAGRTFSHQAAERDLPLCSVGDTWRGSRCERYCSVNKWCDQYQETKKTGLRPKGEE